jgi:hypothetical protein
LVQEALHNLRFRLLVIAVGFLFLTLYLVVEPRVALLHLVVAVVGFIRAPLVV